jgi:hypothetical protein
MTRLWVLGLLVSVTLGACGGSPDSGGSSGGSPSMRASPGPPLDSHVVPADLRHLIPLAQEWGIGDDVERLAKVDGATPAQRAELRRTVGPHQARITQWLDSFGQGEMSQEAATFMYMQLAIEEMVGRP